MSKLKQKLDARKNSRRYYETKFILEVIDALGDCLENSEIKKKDVADKLGLSKGRISQYFSGKKNITLRTLASILWAFGKRGRLVIDDADCQPTKFHFLQQCFQQEPRISAYKFDIDASSSENTLSA